MSRRAPRSRSALNLARFLTVLVAVTGVVVGIVAPTTVATATASQSTTVNLARAAGDPAQTGIVKSTLVGFNPGNLISDAVFTNKNSMTEAQIQSFFNGKVSRCLGGTDENGKPIICLKDFRITSVNRPADSYCSGYSGAANESAARVIYRVAQACNINPQVLIVMLQKEQGLITHTWPSAWRYDSALGQGCPDTAPCDPNFVGFFHQIYGAARQMQIYLEGKWFQWYAPGKTWNIRYDTEESCGSSPVYIANKATSAMYYYTPYQPNAAALRAGTGLAEPCGAYGNRNFYNYFTDWFGSTQGAPRPDGPIVNVGPDIYAITNGTAYHIGPAVWPQYRAAFGSPDATTNAHIASLAQGGEASLFVHDEGKGTVAYLDGGKTHRFPTCALVAAWGGTCESLTRFDSEDFSKPGAGAQMTPRVNVAGDSRLFLLQDGALMPYQSTAALLAWGQITTGYYAATMPAATAARYAALPTRFVPGTFISPAGSTRVYLPGANAELHYLPSWDLARSAGLTTTVASVSAASIAQYRTTTSLDRFVVCEDRTYFTAGGSLYRVATSDGFNTVALDAPTCSTLKVANDMESKLFVQASGDTAVYTSAEGRFSHVGNPPTLSALNGPGAARVVKVAPADLANLPKGAQIRADIGFVLTPGDGKVYLADAGRLVYLTSWSVADALGLPRGAVAISDAAGNAMPKDGAVSSTVSCAGLIYTASGGVLTRVESAGDVAVTALSAGNCANLRLP